MEKKYTLQEIIECVIDEKYEENEDNAFDEQGNDMRDNDIRRLRRNFYGLIEGLGATKELLKEDGKSIRFKEKECFVIKYILTQIYEKEGIIYEFAMNSNKGPRFSSKKVHRMVQELCDAGEKEGMDENELMELTHFFSNIFLESPLRSIEYCHMLIDALALNLQDLTSEQKAIYLLDFEKILKKEFVVRCTQLASNASSIGELIEIRKELEGDDIYCGELFEYEPMLRSYYIERDKELLGKIQEDDDLRCYVEKKFGKKAEEIFNYTKLNK